jgi:hypothetical protein
MPGAGRLDGLFDELSAIAVDRNKRMGLLVRVDSDHHTHRRPPIVQSALAHCD